MFTCRHKNSGQVTLETVLVIIFLAVIAVGAIGVFSNYNLQMLKRLDLFRDTRRYAANDPSALQYMLVDVAPRSEFAMRAVSNATTFLDYYPRSIGSIVPDVPQGAFFWDYYGSTTDLEFYLALYKTELIFQLVLPYKLNQANWCSDNLKFTTYFYPYSYIRKIKWLMNQCIELNDVIYANMCMAIDRMYDKFPDQYTQDREEIKDNLKLAMDMAENEYIFIRDNIATTVYNPTLRRWVPSPDHLLSMDKLDALVGLETVDAAGIPILTGMEFIPYPFFDLQAVVGAYFDNTYLSGDVTEYDAKRALYWADYAMQTPNLASEHPIFYEYYDSLRNHIDSALTYWAAENSRLYSLGFARLEAWALYAAAEGTNNYW